MQGRMITSLALVGVLALGSCSESAQAPTSSESAGTASQTVSQDAGEALVLRGDGLGPVRFGALVEEALPQLIDILGPPEQDSTERGWMPGGLGGKNTTVRALGWDGLWVAFTDWPYFRDDGAMHLASWHIVESDAGPSLKTAEGIRVGSTLGKLRTAFGENLKVHASDCTDDWQFFVPPKRWLGLGGAFAEEPHRASVLVTALWAGYQGSC